MIALLLQMAQLHSISPFSDEPAAAHALESVMQCVGDGLYNRRSDTRAGQIVTNEVRQLCLAQTNDLRAQLIAVFERNPVRLPAGATAGGAADTCISNLLNRVEIVIDEARAHEKAANAQN